MPRPWAPCAVHHPSSVWRTRSACWHHQCPIKAGPCADPRTGWCWPVARTAAEADLVGLYDVFDPPAGAGTGPGAQVVRSPAGAGPCRRRAGGISAGGGWQRPGATHLPAPGFCRRLRLPLPHARGGRALKAHPLRAARAPFKGAPPAARQSRIRGVYEVKSQAQGFVQAEVHVHRLHGRTAGALAQVVQA